MALRGTILIADDDSAIQTVLTQAFSRLGYEVRVTGTTEGLWRWVEAGEGDLVITDVIMPDENGLDLIPRIKGVRPAMRIIVMSAQNTLQTAVKATELGAFEYLPKPFDLNYLVRIVDNALQTPAFDEQPLLPEQEDKEAGRQPLIGRSPAMQEVYRLLARTVGTDLTVIVTGESGTGKELVARALHNYGKRRSGPFVALNMAAIARELIESELFGYEKGAFTGALTRSAGRFEQARGGTLLLDEIGDMPLDAQTRLLRVLQEGEYTTIGGRLPIKADMRIIAATHRDLKNLIQQGSFREDLFHRLNVVTIRMPALRERLQDVPALVQHFFRLRAQQGLPVKRVDKAAMERLKSYRWPGNVRELENLVSRLAALYSQDIIGVDIVEMELSEISLERSKAQRVDGEGLSGAVERHLRDYFAAHQDCLPAAGLYERVLREIERPLLHLTLTATRGNQIKAAQLLGLNRNTLRKKIRDLDVQVVRSIK